MNDLNFCSRGNDFEAYTKKGVFLEQKTINIMSIFYFILIRMVFILKKNYLRQN